MVVPCFFHSSLPSCFAVDHIRLPHTYSMRTRMKCGVAGFRMEEQCWRHPLRTPCSCCGMWTVEVGTRGLGVRQECASVLRWVCHAPVFSCFGASYDRVLLENNVRPSYYVVENIITRLGSRVIEEVNLLNFISLANLFFIFYSQIRTCNRIYRTSFYLWGG